MSPTPAEAPAPSVWPFLAHAGPSWRHSLGLAAGLPPAGPGKEAPPRPATCVSLRGCVVLAPHLWFSCSVQHQGRLSLDLSHRACSDYSEMRAPHGSNSLPSSARLGNCAQDLPTAGAWLVSLHHRLTPRGVPASPPFRGGGLGSALHLSFGCLLCLFLFPGGHGVVPVPELVGCSGGFSLLGMQPRAESALTHGPVPPACEGRWAAASFTRVTAPAPRRE